MWLEIIAPIGWVWITGQEWWLYLTCFSMFQEKLMFQKKNSVFNVENASSIKFIQMCIHFSIME